MCFSPSSASFNLDYNTDMEDHSVVGEHFHMDGHKRNLSKDSVIGSLFQQGLTVDWVNTLDDPSIWIDQFNPKHNSIAEDILPGGYLPDIDSLINSDEQHKRPPIIHKNTAPTTLEGEQASGLTNSASWPDLVFDPEIVIQDPEVVDLSYGINSNVLGDDLLTAMQTDSGDASCTDESRADENIQTAMESSVGRVTLVIDGCNRDTLHSLLDLTKSLKEKTKIEID